MVAFILFVLATIGLTYILVDSKVLDDDHLGWRSTFQGWLGKYKDLLECYACTSFWTGLVMGLLFITWNPFYILGCGFAGTCLGHLYRNVMDLIESKIEFVIDVGENEPAQPEAEPTQEKHDVL